MQDPMVSAAVKVLDAILNLLSKLVKLVLPAVVTVSDFLFCYPRRWRNKRINAHTKFYSLRSVKPPVHQIKQTLAQPTVQSVNANSLPQQLLQVFLKPMLEE